MDLKQMMKLQQEFDSLRETTFQWSQQITADDTSALRHNVLALAGEVGELANLVKKFERGDFSYDRLMGLVPGELADVLIYLIKIAYQSGLDLEQAFLEKLSENEQRFPKSQEAHSDQAEDGVMYAPPESRKLLRLSPEMLRANLETWTEVMTPLVREEDVAIFEQCAQRAGARIPMSVDGKFAAAFLSILYYEAGLLEGRPLERERIWSRIQPAASLFSLENPQIAALTSEVDALRNLLSKVSSRRRA
ncbi:MazG nucleotide pyrophosphohydrolase domain-containing protein [Pseudarthrobacter sulfonivorans]|uniref:MazG nucleotide pyrophosphohydrolase domain-containing protein n=1 Tax=Pseudarthrobacter sulfonivorans TaxID=121292 RepID=UPI00277D6C92|nr:MazG nucleotide pyrophosphohydrolase domain-containing protein [Pseudarthrobacter sulfonivorans]MDP9998284.1 NTP pyrophosphatase (non-canonical NTP hydrolase) [Pseudarthrobacter sulfonivorans]